MPESGMKSRKRGSGSRTRGLERSGRCPLLRFCLPRRTGDELRKEGGGGVKEGTETPCAFGGAGKQGEKEGEGNAEGPAGAERAGSGAGAARNAGRGFPTSLGPPGPHFPSSASPTASGLGRAAHTGAKAAAAGSLMGETGRRGPGGGVGTRP